MANLLKTKHFIFYGNPTQMNQLLEEHLESFINAMDVNVIEMSHAYGVNNGGVPYISVLVAYSHIPVVEKGASEYAPPSLSKEEVEILLDKGPIVKDTNSGLNKNTGSKNKNKK